MKRATKPLSEGPSWTFSDIQAYMDVLGELAESEFELDVYSNQIEIVSSEQMLDAYAFNGLPSCYHHWRYGKYYSQTQGAYQRGLTNLAYELVINSNPSISYFMEENNMVTQALVAAHACVSGDTEYLSRQGWKRLDEYDGGEVGQYNEDGSVTFVTPSNYIVNENVEWLYEVKSNGPGVSMRVTPDHGIYYQYNKQPHKLLKRSMEEVRELHRGSKYGFSGKIRASFQPVIETELPLSDDELRLYVAFIADGSFENKGRAIKFHFSKERKIERLSSLLTRLGIPFSLNEQSTGNYKFYFNIDNCNFLKSKLYDTSFYDASIAQLRVIADECFFWDGRLKDRTFFTTEKESADFIQYACTVVYDVYTSLRTVEPRGNAIKVQYHVHPTYKSTVGIAGGPTTAKGSIRKIPTTDGRSYCFTVPSGMFVMRCDDAILLTSNCYGHNSFFKNNFLFREWTQADAIVDYTIFAKNYIAECEEKYGWRKVEETLDAAHTIEKHGIYKYKRPPQLSSAEEREMQKQRMLEREKDVNYLWNVMPNKTEKDERDKEKFPSEPEENILYFLEKHSPMLEDWQREILRIVRKLAQYFYPQAQTKVMNEGYASYWHYTLLYRLWELGYLTDGFMQSFLSLHTAVLNQPGYNEPGGVQGLNPYYLGFNSFVEIERICKEPTEEDEEFFPQIAGKKADWIKEIHNAAYNFKDESFILQYLSPNLMRKMRMFTLLDDSGKDHYEVVAISNSDGYREMRSILSKIYNRAYQVPDVQVIEADIKGDRTLTLHHSGVDDMPLEEKSKTAVLKHIQYLWGFDVKITSDAKPELPWDEDDYYVWV